MQTSTTYGFAVPPADGPAHLSGRAPHTFPVEDRTSFRTRDPRTFRAEGCRPFQAGRAALVRPAGRGLCALPGGACAPYRAGLVRPAGLGRAGPHTFPEPSQCTLSAEPAHPSGPGRPSTMRVTHTLQSGPGIFSKYLWIKYLRTSACAAFCHDSFTMPKTFSLREKR